MPTYKMARLATLAFGLMVAYPETPWRQVEAMLLMAAARTPKLL